MRKSSGCGWGYKGISIFLISFLVLTVFSFSAYAREVDEINAAIQAKGGQWVAEENELSRLPREEKIKRLGILEGDDSAYLAAEPAPLPSPDATGLASWMDWRNNGGNFVSPVKDQGSCGSCWAFSATAALESKLMIYHNSPGYYYNLSEQVLVSCVGPGNDCGGGYETNAANYIKNTGIPVESCYPYTVSNGNCGNACAARLGQSFKVSGWGSISKNVTAIKTAIATYGPVVARYAVYEDFYSYKSGVYSYAWGGYMGLHAILVVGWDDAYQCFIVKNSWGSGWGESGYFRIAYSQLNAPVNFGSMVEAYYDGLYPWDNCTDAYEPNDTSGSAYPIGPGAYSAKICSPSDVDWFVINMGAAGLINLNLLVPAANDYDLEMYNPLGNRVGFSNFSTGYPEAITYAAGITGPYGIAVYGYNKDYNTLNAYTLNDAVTGISITNLGGAGPLNGCAYFVLPGFSWVFGGPTNYYTKMEIQFSADSNFLTYKKAPLALGSTTYTPTSAMVKKILLLPGVAGGPVYGRVAATMTDKGIVYSNVYSFTIDAPAAAGNPQITPTSKASLPTLSWNENCNNKFKTWFGSAADFTLTTTKKKALAFNDALPTDNGEVFSQLLTSGQWTAIQSVVGGVPGQTIYWYVEGWDAAKRYSKTGVMNFPLNP